MLKSLAFLSLLATLPLASAQNAQSASSDNAAPSQPAPIIRRSLPDTAAQYRRRPQQLQIVESQPTPGVWLRSASTANLKTISATPQRTEVRLDRGRLNVNIHQPTQHSEILVDLPGGQTSLLKDGLYTFNADTNTVRVLHGEAAAWPGLIDSSSGIKPIKIKEDHQLSLASTGGNSKSVESYPYEITADLLPRDSDGDRAYGGGGYGGGGYGNGYVEDYPPYGPYYGGGWGYPGFYPPYYDYGFGYPYGYGIGFGYYGGFGGFYHGGFRGRGGFRR